MVAEDVSCGPLCGCWEVSPRKISQCYGHEEQKIRYVKLFGGFMFHAETRLFLSAFSFLKLGLALAVDKYVCQRGNIPVALRKCRLEWVLAFAEKACWRDFCSVFGFFFVGFQ